MKIKTLTTEEIIMEKKKIKSEISKEIKKNKKIKSKLIKLRSKYTQLDIELYTRTKEITLLKSYKSRKRKCMSERQKLIRRLIKEIKNPKLKQLIATF